LTRKATTSPPSKEAAAAPADATKPGSARNASGKFPAVLPSTLTASDGALVPISPAQQQFLLQLAEALNTTLDLDTLMHRVAQLVRAVLDYRIFAILLVNERSQELRMRFQIGHSAEAERLRIPIGKGVVGEAAEKRQPVLVRDVSEIDNYIVANPNVRSELAVPLITRNRVIGVIDIQSEQVDYFQPEHLRLLELTASRVATAIENARLYTRVARQANTLAVLNEISREITSILDLDQLLIRIGELLHRVIDYRMYSILLLNEKKQVLEHRLSVRYGVVEHFGTDVSINEGLVGAAAREGHPVLASDVQKDPRYRMLNPETRSELAVPLVYKGKTVGVLDLEHTRRHYFNEEHVRTLHTLASQIAVSIENARLYQRVAQEEQRMERDLAMAREVQLRLLPAKVPELKNADFAARFLPARSIGGDLYDFLDYGDGKMAVVLGDVSGKAAPAALYAALVSGIMRSQAANQPSPAAMLAYINEALRERRLDSQYVTMLYALWDDNQRTLQIANAGAVQPLFVRGQEPPLTLQAAGFPLGLFPDVTYEEFSVSTQPGDSLVFFSDGIVDAENPQEDMFGNDRLEAVLNKNRRRNAGQIADAVLTAVTAFQSGRERFDDETIVAIKVR
jgi:sigma-B regulation protein RsbU (phosphoserine phosphatase)